MSLPVPLLGCDDYRQMPSDEKKGWMRARQLARSPRVALAVALAVCGGVFMLSDASSGAATSAQLARLTRAAGVLLSSSRATSSTTGSFKPVVAMHGLNHGADFFNKAEQWIQTAHPGTRVYKLALYEYDMSLSALPPQLNALCQAVRTLTEKEPDVFANGYHLLCHSQGAVLCRALTQVMDDHAVDTLVAVAGPQLGAFGSTWFLHNDLGRLATNVLPAFGFGLADSLAESAAEETAKAYHQVAYTPQAQQDTSLAELWNDPYHHDQFLRWGEFLGLINGLRGELPEQMRKNFLRLHKAVFLVGSNANHSYDSPGGLEPWFSAVFAYWADNSEQVVVPMRKQQFYVEDRFGLRSLDETRRLNTTAIPGVAHSQWFQSQETFNQHILPHLT